MNAHHIGLLLLASGIALLVACGSDSDKRPESQPDEVNLRFAEWLCPEDPDYALFTYQPSAEFKGGEWRVTVQEGTLRASEPDLVFLWDEPRLGERMLAMRSEDRCE